MLDENVRRGSQMSLTMSLNSAKDIRDILTDPIVHNAMSSIDIANM